MKKCAYSSLILGLLVLLFIVNSVNGGGGSLGMADYNVHETVHAGYTKTFAVGTVFNEGDAPLSVSSYWIQKSGDITLSISVEPQTKILDPSRSYEVFVTVHEDSVSGEYSGTVEVEATSLEHGSGNPIVGAREANVQVTIVGTPPPEETPPTESGGNEVVSGLPIRIEFLVFSVVAVSLFISGVYVVVKKVRGRGYK